MSKEQDTGDKGRKQDAEHRRQDTGGRTQGAEI